MFSFSGKAASPMRTYGKFVCCQPGSGLGLGKWRLSLLWSRALPKSELENTPPSELRPELPMSAMVKKESGVNCVNFSEGNVWH